MRRVRIYSALLVLPACAGWAQAQDQLPAQSSLPAACNIAPDTISLTVAKGAALQIVIDKEIRIEKIGQRIHGRTVEPVYAFDRLVIPASAEVTGRITQLEGVSNGKRTLEALNADFSPARKVAIEFDEVALPDGKHIPVQTAVTPGSGQVIEFVATADKEQKRSAKDLASEKIKETKQRARDEWDRAVAQVEEPGKIHRAKRYLVAQLPVHPQYILPGTVYFAELLQPLEFGTEPLTPETAHSIGAAPPDGSSIRAHLGMELSSATARKGDVVEAVLSQPLYDDKFLLFPQGSRLRGSVVQVQPARHMSRNGQLRLVFHEIVPPSGIERKVQASLESVQSDKAQSLKLDSEGGVEARAPKTRYLQAGIAVGLAAASSGDDGINQAEGGAGGFRVVGIVLGATVRSHPLGMAMGALGAARSIYVHFVARGRDVVFPKNTAMELVIGPRPGAPAGAKPAIDTIASSHHIGKK